MTQVKGVTFRVDGRNFVQETPSFEQEMYIMEQCVQAGLDQVALETTPDGKDLEPAIKRLLIQAYRSGALFKLMAALVVEENKEWTEESAERNANLFRKARDSEAKDGLRPALIGALLAFFESGASLRQISGISTALETDDTIDPAVRPKRGPEPVLSPEAAGALFSSGRSAPSSGKSPSTKRKSPKTSSR